MEKPRVFTRETLDTYNRYIDERVLEAEAMETQIYTLMMLVKGGRSEAMSSSISIKKIMDIGTQALTNFNLLTEDFKPVLEFGGYIINGHWRSEREISFKDANDGTIHTGYLMPYQDGIDTSLLSEVKERDLGVLV